MFDRDDVQMKVRNNIRTLHCIFHYRNLYVEDTLYFLDGEGHRIIIGGEDVKRARREACSFSKKYVTPV